MSVPPWLRLWLPLGNILLLVAIVETVDLIRNEMKDLGIFLYQGYSSETIHVPDFYHELELIFIGVCFGIRLIATIALFWVGFILKGHKGSLFAWIVITVISVIVSVIIVIFNAAQSFQLEYSWPILYMVFAFLIFNSYFLFIAYHGYQALCRQESLHPIGKGIVFIWDYFSNESKVAATFFLTSELFLDAYYLLNRQFVQLFGIHLQGHDSDRTPAIIVEEIVFRFIRLFVNSFGLWLVATDKRRLFRWWCALTFGLILISTTFFIVLTVIWRGEDISVTLSYFLLFPGHLLYRFLTLYFCLKYTRADFSSLVL